MGMAGRGLLTRALVLTMGLTRALAMVGCAKGDLSLRWAENGTWVPTK